MPRTARKKSNSGIYHVMVRGINRQDIFQDDEDRQKFLTIVKTVKETSQFNMYGYCLMDNHVHLLIQEFNEDLSQIMKRIGTSYAYWYNNKYDRSGHLFQDRYKSENVENDGYFLTVLRYIHQNPLKAKKVTEIGDYHWSSYRAYLDITAFGLIDTRMALEILGLDHRDAIDAYKRYMREINSASCLDDRNREKMKDDEVRAMLTAMLNNRVSSSLLELHKTERDAILKRLKMCDGISIRQIERITGLGRNIIANA